jgi:transposase-like protein
MSESRDVKRANATEFWDAAVRLWTESGMPVRAFCRQEGLAEHSFYAWRKKLSPKNDEAKASPSTFIADAAVSKRQQAAVAFATVHVLDEEIVGKAPCGMPAVDGNRTIDSEPPAIEIHRGTDWWVRVPVGFDPATLDAAIAVLEQRERRSC